MPAGSNNDPVPSAARMLGKKRGAAPAQAAFSFELAKEMPAALPPDRGRYQPIVLTEPEPAPMAVAPTEPVLYSVRRLLAEVRGQIETAFGASVHVEG